MKEQALMKKIEDQARIFKSRQVKGVGDEKRHDRVHQDEQKWMRTAYEKLDWSFAKIGSIFDRDERTVKQAVQSQHKQEESLMVHSLSSWTTGVEFLVTNTSNNLVIVHRICVEIAYWEQYDAPLTTGARIIDYKYTVKVKPNFIGEILVPTPKFKYYEGDVDNFSISFISPPRNKYVVRIIFYCSNAKTGKRFTISTDKFEIRFHKTVGSRGTLSCHDAVAQARKITDEGKWRHDAIALARKITDEGKWRHDAIALARKIIDERKRKK